MRAFRVVGLFFALLLFALIVTTRHVPFRDAALAFVFTPSMRAWSQLAATVHSPLVLLVLLTIIYASYMTFFFVSSTRGIARS
jgi:hypothetical protein